MKITNRELLNKVNLLQGLSQKQLPVKLSYAIAKNINIINNEIKLINEEKQKIINDYALKDEQGNTKIEDNRILFESDEKEQECTSKYNELLDIENEIKFRGIFENELEKANCTFSAAELIELEFMIVE